MTPTLYHFACSHTRDALGRRGTLVPSCQLSGVRTSGNHLVWLTSDPDPDREALGLTMQYTTSDRMQFRYRVLAAPAAVAWIGSGFRTPELIAGLEGPYHRPESWWVSPEPVRVRLDRVRPPMDAATARKLFSARDSA